MSYNTDPQAPPPAYSDVTSYQQQGPAQRSLGGSQYVEIPQSDHGYVNPGYKPGAPGTHPQDGGYPPPHAGGQPSPQAGGYPPPQAGGYPPPQAGGYPPTQAGGYPPTQAGGYPSSQPSGYMYSTAPAPSSPAREPVTEPGVMATAEENWDSETGLAGHSFTDKGIRRAFVRKVYLILMVQLLVTVGIICFFIFHTPTRDWIRYRSGSYFYYCAYGVFLVTYIALVCCPTVRRKSPGNYICLTVFTLAFAWMAGTISCFHSTDIVLISLGITAAVCLAITLFACQTKIDFTMCSGLLFALLMVLFFFGWSCLIVYLITGVASQILNCVYAALGALVFSLFLIYDTQMLLGGKKHQLSPEEYIFGALQLYLDVVYIFLFIMSLAGSSKS